MAKEISVSRAGEDRHGNGRMGIQIRRLGNGDMYLEMGEVYLGGVIPLEVADGPRKGIARAVWYTSPVREPGVIRALHRLMVALQRANAERPADD